MKRISLLFVIVIVLAVALPAAAQDSHTLSYDGFSFTYTGDIGLNVQITHIDNTGVVMEGPVPADPPHTEIILTQNQPPAVAPMVVVLPTAVRIYPIAAASAPEYQYAMETITALQTLLAQRPDLNTYMDPATPAGTMSLPRLPLVNAAQVLRARAKYVDLGTLSGVSYLTTYAQGLMPFASQSFWYTFQGISSDGQYYVAVDIPVYTDLFPYEIPADFDYDTWFAALNQYNADSLNALNMADPNAFMPSLNSIEQMVGSMVIGG